MNNDEILHGVAEVLNRHFNIDPRAVTTATSAFDVDGWDSVNHVYVMLDVEKRFGVKLPAERIFALENVGELVDLLAERMAQG